MPRHLWRFGGGVLLAAMCLGQTTPGLPAQALTWQDAVATFKQNNPALLAGKFNIDEAKADEITAYLRPNPNLNLTADDLGLFTFHPFQPTANAILAGSVDYLHEREHKRELRLESAKGATAIAFSTQTDLERNLLFNLRDAFVRVLLAKAVRAVAQTNLEYYDKEIQINKQRLDAGAIAVVDFERIAIQRVQFQTDLQNAEVNLRTAKIDLLQFLNDRAPVDTFDVTENFDYDEPTTTLEEARQEALNSRPDLREAQQAVEKARVDHRLAIANGSADPTFSGDVGRQPPLAFYAGVSVSIPLRIFDKNQGEKLRTDLVITQSQKQLQAAQMQVTHDVDSAWATVESTLSLLRPYKETYLKQAARIRDTVSFSYEHGAASLLDFLDAQKEYRDTELDYLNLVGSYLSAANQLNLAVGREVLR